MELMDLKFNGPQFTSRGTRNGELVDEGIDRGLCNQLWLARWPNTAVIYAPVVASDHSPIVIHCELTQQKGSDGLGKVLECVTLMVTDAMNQSLMIPIMDEEIKEAARQMGGLKAPGPNGFSSTEASHSQSYFSHAERVCRGRQIQGNIRIAHELFHFLKLRKAKCKFKLGIKLDMHKAYDRVK
ncbi:hypothetical protein FF1_012550 [Malus domestica]